MPKQLDTGTPQGSILSPLLFTIVINDLPGNITSSSTFYADDFCSGRVDLILNTSSRDDKTQVKSRSGAQNGALNFLCQNQQQFSLQKKESKLTFFNLPKHHSDS